MFAKNKSCLKYWRFLDHRNKLKSKNIERAEIDKDDVIWQKICCFSNLLLGKIVNKLLAFKLGLDLKELLASESLWDLVLKKKSRFC